MEKHSIKRTRPFLHCLPLLGWALVSAWASGFKGWDSFWFVGHWYLIPLALIYLVWIPLIVWITNDDRPSRRS